MTPLDKLAAANGIEADFRDAQGRLRETSLETKRALLSVLGSAASDDVAAAAVLERRARADWLQPLPPVTVAAISAGPPVVEVVLPAQTRTLSWRLEFEDGSLCRGDVSFASLPKLAERNLDGERYERRLLAPAVAIPCGYHRLTLAPDLATMALIVTPGRCWLPPALEGRTRLWGVAAQLYLLRSSHNWGIGNFTDLESLVRLLAARGADVVGLNPLHALFLDDPEHASPYSPASRLLLNVLNIDVTAVPGFEDCARVQALTAAPDFQARLAACRDASLVKYSDVSKLLMPVLRLLYEWSRTEAGSENRRAFESFTTQRGDMLRQACVFQALRDRLIARDARLADWRRWPPEFHAPSSPAVGRFALENDEEVTFLMWLQWVADVQLAAAAAAACDMAVGLYRDLAVGADLRGDETWSNANAVLRGAHIGAPPDIYNALGQDWGLPPFHPRALRDEAYRSFINLVRANMRYAGAMRIDHVMALQRLYLIPPGATPLEGAYVRYPLEDLIGILALESHRNQCLVIGEDLGTVPDGFRERMAAANILSYRVLFFETEPETGAFLPPERYPEFALAAIGSHDLPTLRAWWAGSDIELKERLGLFLRPEEALAMRLDRERERRQFVAALRAQRLLGEDVDDDALLRATHAFLARTASLLALAQIDDLTGEMQPVNVPATTHQHPNWRRRQSVSLEDLASDERLHAIAEIFGREGRGRATGS